MTTFLSNPKYSDAVVKIGASQWKIHRIVFAQASTYFETLFDSGMKDSTTVELVGVSPETFGLFVEWVYTTFFSELKGIGQIFSMGVPTSDTFRESYIFSSPAFSKYAWIKGMSKLSDHDKLGMALTYDIDFGVEECCFSSPEEAIQLAKEIDTPAALVRMFNLLTEEQAIYLLMVWMVLNPKKPVDIKALIKTGKIWVDALIHIPQTSLKSYTIRSEFDPLFAAFIPTFLKRKDRAYTLAFGLPLPSYVLACATKDASSDEADECELCSAGEGYCVRKYAEKGWPKEKTICLECLRKREYIDQCHWCTDCEEDSTITKCTKCSLAYCLSCGSRHTRRCG